MTNKESHPYLNIYPLTKAYKFLVIGTMPPSREIPDGVICKEKKKKNRTFNIDYFYGNAATFWGILRRIYAEYSFDTIENIQQWQDDYGVGITDTIKTCRRKDPCSYRDSDLIVEWSDYNHELRTYITQYKDDIEKLIFTSGENCNNALANFKIIMGDSYYLIADKVITDLPSPSGGSNTANFNSDEGTLGLKQYLYDFLISRDNQNEIDFVKNQWIKKKAAAKGEKIKRIPENLLTEFKIEKYREIFPTNKCAEK